MTTNENSAFITGTAVSPYYLAYTTEDGICYKVLIATQRHSGIEDTIPVIVPESCLENLLDPTGRKVTVKGSFQSRSRHSDGKHHLDLFVYADIFTFAGCGMATDTGNSGGSGNTSGTAVWKDDNRICLEGYITKQPIFRTTPKERKITDMLIAVNGPDPMHPNYIPCIAWGRNAYLAKTLQPSDHIRIKGRAQSREYEKILHSRDGGEDTIQKRVAYEISCSTLEVLEQKVDKGEEEAG